MRMAVDEEEKIHKPKSEKEGCGFVRVLAFLQFGLGCLLLVGAGLFTVYSFTEMGKNGYGLCWQG